MTVCSLSTWQIVGQNIQEVKTFGALFLCNIYMPILCAHNQRLDFFGKFTNHHARSVTVYDNKQVVSCREGKH